MIRAPLGDSQYWDMRVSKDFEWLRKAHKLLETANQNPTYGPEFAFNLTRDVTRLLLRRYSRGDPVAELSQHFPDLLDAWELSDKLARELDAQLQPGQGWDQRHLATAPVVSDDPRANKDPRSWIFELKNLNHYNWCLWLVALALLLDVPEDQWQRLVVLIGGEGEDAVLDRIMATRSPDRQIGLTVLHPRPYARLLKAIDALPEQRSKLLEEFVVHWYAELARKGADELWWYTFGDPVKHPLSMGSYFGRWCLEAAVAAKVFGIDDSQCLNFEHYPGDFLRPDAPQRRAAVRMNRSGWLDRLFGGRR